MRASVKTIFAFRLSAVRHYQTKAAVRHGAARGLDWLQLCLEPHSRRGPHLAGDDDCVPPEEVRERFKRIKLLKELSVKQRGWTLNVLNIVRRLTEEKCQRAGAVQDASRNSKVIGKRASVLDCGGPPPLSPASECSKWTFTPSPASWSNYIPATAMSATKSASNCKSSGI